MIGKDELQEMAARCRRAAGRALDPVARRQLEQIADRLDRLARKFDYPHSSAKEPPAA